MVDDWSWTPDETGLDDEAEPWPAPAAHDHPLAQAHSRASAASGQTVYCICGWQGCTQRQALDAAVWEAERARRADASAGVQVWYARGDRLVPVAPDVDGRVPAHERRRA